MGLVRKLGQTRIEFLISLGLFLAVCLVYFSIPSYDFNSYDDVLYVVENTIVQKGLSLSNLYWAFTTFSASNWHPVTWLSHMLDCSLFGMNPGGHHWTSLLLHSLNSILLFIILLYMTGAVWRSAFVAMLFAVHPLHVESVAWVAERKDLLSAFFAFLAIWSYCAYIKLGRKRYYWGAVFLFAVGLMAKAMLVTLPFILILLDFWPLGRLKFPMGLNQVRAQFQEKLPFFILSLISSVLTILAQQNAIQPLSNITFQERLGNTVISYFRYLERTFRPVDLACFYPFTELETGLVVIGFAALCGLTLIAVRAAKFAPYIPIGWFWYLGTLVPVIGIVQVGSQSMADRYTYIPLIGIFMIFAWGLESLTRNSKYGRILVLSCVVAILILLSAVANIQASYWKNSKTLFGHAIDVTSENFIAHNNLGTVYYKEKNYERAEYHFREAVKFYPDYKEAIYNLATVNYFQGRLDAAIYSYRKYLELEKDSNFKLYASAHMNLAMALLKTEQTREAESIIKKFVISFPDNAMARNHYGIVLIGQGRLAEALAQFEKALSLDPGNRHYALNVQKLRDGYKNADGK